MEGESEEFRIKSISPRNWFIIFILGISGQIAWAVENSWFNTFVFDELTPNPQPVAWMVAVSAITATVTTYIIGSLSDRTKSRWGRRKPFLVAGYFFWGITTALFPTVSWIDDVGIAVVMVIIADAIMTFFGSTANDAAYNAWVTDITDPTNRGRLQGIISTTTLLANLIALGAAGFVIDAFGYFVFFYVLGGIVTLTGIITAIVLKESVSTTENRATRKPILQDLIDTLKPSTVKENKLLYLLFGYMALTGIASNISFPYQFIYFEHHLGFTKSEISIIGAAIIMIAVIVSIFYGFISHKFNRKVVLFILPILGLIPGIGFMLVQTADIFLIILVAGSSISLGMISGITLGAWIQDNYPSGNIGRFQGVRMIFFVLIPMVIGPPIGAFVIETFGVPTILNGEPGFIPPPEIFLASTLFSLIAIVILFFITMEQGLEHLKRGKEA
ncbi:MAG: MFS transporter [Candidatus Heimdallarchaeota archaeon]|nr:MAG: MFS transporter [Candidatus Heimdallarchaeota archaeon]